MAQGIKGGAGVGGSAYVGPGGPVTPPGSGGGETPTTTNTVDNDIPVLLWTEYAGYLPNGRVFGGPIIYGPTAPASTTYVWGNTSGATTVFMAYDPLQAEWVEFTSGSGGSGGSRNIDGGTPNSIYTPSQLVDGGGP